MAKRHAHLEQGPQVEQGSGYRVLRLPEDDIRSGAAASSLKAELKAS